MTKLSDRYIEKYQDDYASFSYREGDKDIYGKECSGTYSAAGIETEYLPDLMRLCELEILLTVPQVSVSTQIIWEKELQKLKERHGL